MSDSFGPSIKILLYFFDPLCGWCYGFSPVIKQLYDATKRRAQWDILAGGMVVGDRIGPIGRISGFLKNALPRVEGTTGVTFGEAFTTEVLDRGTLILSSVEPSRALQAVKILAPDRAMAFAAGLQRALYDEGRDVTNMGVLGEVAESVRVVGFELEYMKVETYDQTLEEFRLVSDLGVTGFPTLIGVDGASTRVFSRGWAPFDRVFEGINRWLES